MKELVKYIIGVIVLSMFTSCGFVIDKKVVGKYHLIAVDASDQLALCYNLKNGSSIGVVHETVFAVGYNDKYILAKQHPHKFGEELNKTITNYFIVPVVVKKELWTENEVIGPLNEQQFEQKRHVLNLDSVNFSIIYYELE